MAIKYDEMSGPVIDGAFDPIALGFTQYIPRNNYKRGGSEQDYLRYTKKSSHSGHKLTLSMCGETADFVIGLFGDKLDVYINEKGHILLTDGEHVNVRKKHNENSNRREIGIDSLATKYLGIQGEFRRLFLTAKPYAKGNAIIFIPNGERAL